MNPFVLVVAFVFGAIATGSIMAAVCGVLGIIVGALGALWCIYQDHRAIEARRKPARRVSRA